MIFFVVVSLPVFRLHFCMAFVDELQFCMTRALVDDAFLLLPFALLPFCQIVFVFYFWFVFTLHALYFALLPNCFCFLFCSVLRLLCMCCIFVWWVCMTRALVGDAFLRLPFARLPNCFRFLFCSVLLCMHCFCVVFVSELQFCMTRALVNDAFCVYL